MRFEGGVNEIVKSHIVYLITNVIYESFTGYSVHEGVVAYRNGFVSWEFEVVESK